MSRLIIVRQEKGGVGKTFLAIHLTTYLRGLGHKFRPVECNLIEGMVTQMFPRPDGAFVSPLETDVIQGASAMPAFLERITDKESHVIDCGPNTLSGWQTLLQKHPDLRLKFLSSQVKTTMVVPVNGDEKSKEMFVRYGREFPNALRVMCVFRECAAEHIDLPRYPARLTIELPRAPHALFAAYERKLMTVDEIAASQDSRLQEETKLAKVYVRELHSEFDKIREHLVP